ncbi:WD repeat-containing protein 46 [Cimex lectularius]|uniref:BING4 C-terminal domain-containing protein n=1 Tax=Cimex lectularius TaxID=79782 RepID=A0A8I6RYF9_CIMLE|nr:WD repeat-containing protein 46 [Cimex lectularius]
MSRELTRKEARKKNKWDKERIPIPPKVLAKHSRGTGMKRLNEVENKSLRTKMLRKEKTIEWAEKQAARTEILLTEDAGFIEYDEGETTKTVSQHQIAKNTDILSATKFFELDIPFGPYRIDYTRNGRHLLIGGRKGHVAAFDWVTKRLHCELNVMEEVFDIQWLHNEMMFAVAQKNWVYIYDNQGIELHCLKQLYRVLKMEFLPYHFLLATCNEDGFLCWLDVSIGKMVNTWNTFKGRLSVMTQNPYNAVLCVGHSNGVVSMWSPMNNKPLAQMLCHSTGVQTISIDQSGKYMATTSANREMKVWDVRALSGPLKNYKLRGSPKETCFSQRGCLSLCIGNMVEIYKNCHLADVSEPYLLHQLDSPVNHVKFCPFEDVLGIGAKSGFTSMLVPGSGEPNFDALELNPLQAKSQRREAEVKSLLEKIQPELISLDPSSIAEVNIPTLKERINAKIQILNMKPQKIDFVPRKKRRRNTAKAAKVVKIVRENQRRGFNKELKAAREEILKEAGVDLSKKEVEKSHGVLDRFKSKKQRKNV